MSWVHTKSLHFSLLIMCVAYQTWGSGSIADHVRMVVNDIISCISKAKENIIFCKTSRIRVQFLFKLRVSGVPGFKKNKSRPP